MKLSDVSSSVLHRDSTRYIARIDTVLNASGIKRIQKLVQAYARDHARVLVAPSPCLGVIHRQGLESRLLCDVKPASTLVSVQQTLKISKIKIQAEDAIVFSLLPGGSQQARSLYRAQVKDWADDLIVEEVEWASWIALVTANKLSVSTDN